MSDVLMVVISYENPILTIAALNSLKDQTYRPDVILWDNHSSLATRTELMNYDNFSGLTKFFCEENILWTPAINRAIKTFGDGYQFIGYMNNDIELPPHAIKEMMELAGQDRVGGVAPMAYGIGGTGDYVTHLTRWKDANPEKTEEDFIALGPKRVTYLIGTCVLLSKSVWDRVGELDNEMPLGADDFDYSLRLTNGGYEMYVIPNIVANHRSHATANFSSWGEAGKQSWHRFNLKWANWFLTSEEAINCLWDGEFKPEWETGTGWLSEIEREEIWEKRNV